MRHLRIRGSAGLLIITLSMLLALVVAAPVAAKNPPGNNGTVKIDRLPFDDHPNNEPHVGCQFQVDFYGFDEGDLWADVTFEAHPPTGSGILLTDRIDIGEDDNSGAGSEAGLDRLKGTLLAKLSHRSAVGGEAIENRECSERHLVSLP